MLDQVVIEALGLTKTYGNSVCALDRVNLTVRAGEWVAIMGPSGSGKTTLLNIIGCMDRSTSGTLLLNGTDVNELRGKQLTLFRREVIGLVFQQFHLVPYLTAVENVMLAQYFHSMVDKSEAERMLERVGLFGRLHHLPSQLSGGEQQRVCLARALINEPRIILADEPTGNLDKANEEAVIDLFQQIRTEGRTIVMVTHDPDVAGVADRVIRLDHGRNAGGGTVPVLAAPALASAY